MIKDGTGGSSACPIVSVEKERVMNGGNAM